MLHDMVDSASYMAHGFCLLWKPWLVMLHAISDIVIFVAYFAIPGAIWIFVNQRPDLELRRLAILFAAFIFLCGLTHLVEVITLWFPIYETQGWLKLATAVVSAVTAIAIFPLIPRAPAFPSPRMLQAANDQLKQAQEGLEERVAERTRELELAKRRFEALVQASAQVVWSTSPDGTVVADSPSWRAFTGQTYDQWKGTGWLQAIHPDDRQRAQVEWRTAISTSQLYRVDYRLARNDGQYRWTAARGVPLRDDKGTITEWVGANEDITDRKEQEDHIEMVMRELSHRTKNLLAIIQSIARRSFRGDPTQVSNVQTFNERLHGLSLSHDLLVQGDWTGTSLKDLIVTHLQPFSTLDPRIITLEGPQFTLKSQSAQTLGLALHELATNASKYGALQQEKGRLSITWKVDEPLQQFHLIWSEGVASASPTQQGFGSTILQSIVPSSLSGSATYEINSDSVVWHLLVPLDSVSLDADRSSPLGKGVAAL